MPPTWLATSAPCSISSATSATINPPRATTPGGKPTPRATTRARKQAVVRQHRTAALLRSQLADANVPEHHHLKLIVQLKPDRSRLRPLRIARMFGHHLAVQLDRDLVVPISDANVPEHHHLKLIVQLKPDRSRLRPLRIARMFGHHLAVQLDRDLVVPRDDVHRVPVVVDRKRT